MNRFGEDLTKRLGDCLGDDCSTLAVYAHGKRRINGRTFWSVTMEMSLLYSVLVGAPLVASSPLSNMQSYMYPVDSIHSVCLCELWHPCASSTLAAVRKAPNVPTETPADPVRI